MGQSCAYYSDNIDNKHLALDNLIMAKKLFDLGRELPENYVFTLDTIQFRDDSFFIFALEILTGCEIEVIEDDGTCFLLGLALPEAIQWYEIESHHIEANKEREWILEPLSDEPDGVGEDFKVSIQLLEQGMKIAIDDCYIFYYLFEKLCDCFSRLQQKVLEWNNRVNKER